jgi:hypothetical protein
MDSPEQIFSQEGKWTNVSFEKYKGTYDILKKLERAGTLPEGKTADDPSLKPVGVLMGYGERVLADVQFWASLPEDIPTRLPAYTVKKEELKSELAELVHQSK